MGAGVQEGIGVEALCVEGNVRDTQVKRQQQNEHGDSHPGMGSRGGEDDFQQGVQRVEAVLGDLYGAISFCYTVLPFWLWNEVRGM